MLIPVTRTVTVTDTESPVIILNGANTQEIELGTVYIELGATVTDNDPNYSEAVTIKSSSVDTSTLGQYTVTYSAPSDSAGNTVIPVTRTVTVTDTESPVIILNGANPQEIELGTVYTELGATVTDNVDGDISADIAIDATSVDVASVGGYLVTYNVSDTSGNGTKVTRIVNVVDTTAPEIIMNGSKSIKINQGNVYTDAGAKVIDNDPTYSEDIIVNGSDFDTSIAGSYTITYSAPADASKNSPVQKTRKVIVEAIITTYISIFPNPTNKTIHIDNLTEDTTYLLSNSIGQVIKKGVWTKVDKASIDISSFADGIYLLNIETRLGTAVKRIVKVH